MIHRSLNNDPEIISEILWQTLEDGKWYKTKNKYPTNIDISKAFNHAVEILNT